MRTASRVIDHVPANFRNRRREPVNTFRIQFIINGVAYGVVPLGFDAGSFLNAFRFHKLDGETYDVCQHADGHVSCECKGFLRHGHCKHVKTLVAARMLPSVP